MDDRRREASAPGRRGDGQQGGGEGGAKLRHRVLRMAAQRASSVSFRNASARVFACTPIGTGNALKAWMPPG